MDTFIHSNQNCDGSKFRPKSGTIQNKHLSDYIANRPHHHSSLRSAWVQQGGGIGIGIGVRVCVCMCVYVCGVAKAIYGAVRYELIAMSCDILRGWQPN